jgi:WD40 repeat protein
MARTKKPAQKLELKHVHGFNNFPNGVRYLVDNTGDNTNESQKKATESGAKNGKRRIIFTLGSLGVIQDTANKTGHEQEFFDDHSSRITAMAVHPNGRYVATGQKAPEKGFA